MEGKFATLSSACEMARTRSFIVSSVFPPLAVSYDYPTIPGAINYQHLCLLRNTMMRTSLVVGLVPAGSSYSLWEGCVSSGVAVSCRRTPRGCLTSLSRFLYLYFRSRRILFPTCISFTT